MPTRNVNLTDYLNRVIDKSVASGQFSNASEVVREGLRLFDERDRERKAKLKLLRGALKDGADDLDNGHFTDLATRAELDEFMDQVRREAATERAETAPPAAKRSPARSRV